MFGSFIIGILILIIDLWFHNNWPIFSIINDISNLKLFMGFVFLCLVFFMIYIAFMAPIRFRESNAKWYFLAFRDVVSRGNPIEQKVAAEELAYTFKEILDGVYEEQSRYPFARDIILLMADVNFCKALVEQAPWVIGKVFEDISKSDKRPNAFGVFIVNISKELIMNPNSPLTREEYVHRDGYFGFTKPISNAVYGNSALIEHYASLNYSPFDLMGFSNQNISADFVKLYLNTVRFTLENQFKLGAAQNPSAIMRDLFGMFIDISRFTTDLYKLNDYKNADDKNDLNMKLYYTTGFIREFIDLLDKYQIKMAAPLKCGDKKFNCVYDLVTQTIMNIIGNASYVSTSDFISWAVQHNSLWGKLFGFGKRSESMKIIQFKLRRALYEEIISTRTSSIFSGARYLGYCLYVLGIDESKGSKSDFDGFRKIILRWVKDNYLKLREEMPKVADACIIGSVSFDAEKRQITKTYRDDYKKSPSKDVLQL